MELDESLITWYLRNQRDLPWRNTQDPYRIWLSEIILQQTRVAQGLEYYLKFTHTYPDVGSLAKAPEQEVLKLWQGLGYYSRARNLLATAKFISHELTGQFPETYEGLLRLKGIGPYTASAIASFAFDLPHAVVDGNVYRVLSRVFDISQPINTGPGVKIFQKLAQECLSATDPGTHNQAIMELGALICTPQKPKCEACPLKDKCMALEKNTIAERPVKLGKTKVRDRFMNYLVLETDSEFIFRERRQKDIWQGLNDFASAEGVEEPQESYLESEIKRQLPNIEIKRKPLAPVREYIHKLSHQRIVAKFWPYQVKGSIPENSEFFTVEKNEVHQIAVPRLVHKFLEDQELI